MRGMEQQLILDLKDLEKIGVTCANCGTQVIMDVTKAGCRAPVSCPSCSETFYKDSVRGDSPLDYLVNAMKTQKGKHRITFQVNVGQLQIGAVKPESIG